MYQRALINRIREAVKNSKDNPIFGYNGYLALAENDFQMYYNVKELVENNEQTVKLLEEVLDLIENGVLVKSKKYKDLEI